MSVTVRSARAKDLRRAQELVVASINDLTEHHGFGAMASVRPASFQLFSLQDDPRGLWIAEDDGEIVGAAFSWVCGDLWFLAELFVAPRLQGSGIGRDLLQRALDHAGQSGARTRALITFSFNTVSQGLYIRHGMYPRLPLYMIGGNRSDVRATGFETPLEHRAISDTDMTVLADLDRSVLGVSRQKHHAYLLGEPTMKGFLLYEGPVCAGYAYVASSGHVGPVAVTRPDDMRRALDTALRIAADGQSAQLSAFLPGNCEAALAIAARHRMRITFPMVLVSDREFGDWKRYLPRNPGFM
jgi:ribosomal protein S18 acetylase RimI-like enzyme